MNSSAAKVTTKRQITIPIKIMRKLNLKPGDVLVFEQREDHIEIQPAQGAFTVDDFIRKHSGQNRVHLTPDQVKHAREKAWGVRYKKPNGNHP